jgi:hypothetical protein
VLHLREKQGAEYRYKVKPWISWREVQAFVCVRLPARHPVP